MLVKCFGVWKRNTVLMVMGPLGRLFKYSVESTSTGVPNLDILQVVIIIIVGALEEMTGGTEKKS